jgi:hypothetical protein
MGFQRPCNLHALSPLALLRQALTSVLISRSPRAMHGAIVVADAVADDESTIRISKVLAALDLAATKFPRGYRLAQRYLSRVLVIRSGGQVFAADANACALDIEFIRQEGLARIASVVVHEAVHARVHRVGVPYVLAKRPHIERLCVEFQADALRALDGDEAAEQVIRRLATPWWSDAYRLRRRAAQMRAHGFPPSIVNAYSRIVGMLMRFRRP